MYQSEILDKIRNQPKYTKVSQYDPEFFAARETLARADKPKPRGSWFSAPLKTFSRGLDYLATYNPLESIEAISGMAKDSLASAEKFAKSPFELHKLVKYNSEVKQLNKAKQQGKISEHAYRNRMGIISAEARNLSKQYDPKTAVSDALSASLLIPGTGTVKGIAKGALSFLKREGIKSLAKPTIAKGAKLGLESTMRETGRALISRPLSTPISKGLFKASERLAEGKAVSDIFSKVTGREIKPIKLMEEGKAREAVEFAGMMTTPIPYIGKAFKGVGKVKKYVATATEYQAGESAFKKYFGDALKMKAFQNKELRAASEAQIFKVMKEKGITVNEKNIISFLEDIYSPKIKDLPIISNSIKRLLKANGIEKVEDISKMTDDMLEGILKDKKDIVAIKESIEEMGKVSFTGMHFKTKEDQLKAMAVFEYTGVHTGTWKRSAEELKKFVNETYAKIEKSGAKILGPEIGMKFKGAPIFKPKTSESLLETLNKKTSGTIKAIEDLRKKGIEKIGRRGIENVMKEIKEIKEMRRQLQKTKRGTRKLRAVERKAADDIISELENKYKDLSEIAISVKKQAKIKLTKEMEAKTFQVFKAQLPKTKALVKAPEKISAFTMKPNKLKSGSWENNRAVMGMPKREFSDLYSQGVRDLPKGDISFLKGRKAELGRTLNKMAEGRLGKLLMPQNSKEIYSKIRTKLDNSLVKAFGKDTGKAEKAIQKELDRPLVIGVGDFGIKLPIYRPSERELGKKAWRRIISEATGESISSEKVKVLAKQLNKEMSAAFVTSMKEAGVPTNLIDKMRATSGSFNWMFYNLYTLPRFQLRAQFWMQQVPEVYQWGHARTSKLATGSLARAMGNKQIELGRTINWKGMSETQKEITRIMAIGQTEEISGAGVRAIAFSRKNEANAYGLGFLLEVDKILKNAPKTTKYLKKHGLKSVEDIPYLKKTIYTPLADDAENLGSLLKKYGIGGGKAHLADPTKTVLPHGIDVAEWDNVIRESFKIARANAYKEAIPLFLYNPNRSMLEKSLHAWPMFPLSYALKVADRGGGYILEGKVIRSKVFASIINTMTDIHENEEIKDMESKYWNLFNAAEGLLPIDPSYDFSTGFLPPFSKMLWRWAENPEYYLDEEKGVERSMKVLWPAYREAKGWKQVYDNVKRMNKKVRESGTMTEEEARKIIEEFRFKEPTKVERERLPKLGERPEKKKKAVDHRTAQEKTFAEKKARRKKLLEISPKKKEEKKKFIPKITVPKTFKPKPPTVRPPYSK